jgi:acetoin utilization protein AcuC
LTCQVTFVYGDSLKEYDFGPEHPLRPARLQLTRELISSLGLFNNALLEKPPRIATYDEVALFHDPKYIDFVKEMSKTGLGLLDVGDTPAFRDCYRATCRVVGASLEAIDAVMKGGPQHAMNIAGGLHHAHRNRASGFCIFNDPGVSIAYLRHKFGVKRSMYLDIDVHHGDGVMYGYYKDGSLLDIDFHEDGRYIFPGTGFVHEVGELEGTGLKVNLPLPPGTTDAPYLEAFKDIVPTLVREYKPEFILVQCGADAHANDLLGHLWLTTETYGSVLEIMHQLAHEICNGRIVAFGGGGYHPANVARSWATVAAKLSGADLPQEIPRSWREIYASTVHASAPKLLKEPVGKASAEVTRHITNVVRDVRKCIPEFKK